MPRGHDGERGSGPEIDTVRWALGETTRACACADCWSRRELWRHVRILVGALDRAHAGAPPAEIARWLWEAIGGARRLAVRGPARTRARAVRWLLDYAEREGWTPGQLYEIVLRGVARNR
jgi:hypothetical protein